MESDNILTQLASSENPIVALLALMVLALAGVVVYQWRYTMNKTVPKWVWDSFISKVEKTNEVQDKILLILDERLKK
jgi:hypothetical protein